MNTKNIQRNSNITTYEEVISYLDSIPQFAPLSGRERCSALLERLGHPEADLKIIHVAGTNGKGSACAYLNNILQENGYTVGLFTSPHLMDERERIRIQNTMISRKDFLELFLEVEDCGRALKEENITLAYFDYFLAIALCYYRRSHVDYVILETGLGGKLDGTNAVMNPVLCGITTISLEHMAVLGNTVEQIAIEKAGIIKNGVPVVYLAKNPAVEKVIEMQSKQMQAHAIKVSPNDYQILKNTGNYIDFSFHNEYYKNDCFRLATGAAYQAENCAIALTMAAVIHDEGIASIDIKKSRRAVYQTHWEGRMEEVLPSVYIDGAHNPEGIDMFIRSAEAITRNRSCTLLFSVVRDKDYTDMIKQLCSCNIFDNYIVTGVGGKRQLDGDSIAEVFQRYTQSPVYEFEHVKEAFAYGLQIKKEVLMCTGSLYLVGEIKTILAADAAE
jgi:dihydrofolate synthase/folylpolyglutamate synthase